MRAFVAVLALGLMVAGCGGSGAEETVAAPERPGAPAEATAPAEAAQRAHAPPVEGETLDGSRVALADFRGRPVLVNVWSSW